MIYINELKHYTIDERGGIIAVIDTKHPNFKQRNNGLHSDDPYVVAHWFGQYFPHLGHWSLEDWQIEKAKELCKRLNDLSENSDDVELLKQEEEKPLYVFCPIEKNDKLKSFAINNPVEDDFTIRLDHMRILSQYGDYTFIGYSDHEIENLIYESHDKPIQYVYEDDGVEVKVYPFAVFMKTSELHVGGE